VFRKHLDSPELVSLRYVANRYISFPEDKKAEASMCRILVIPATDWLGGPESRLHRIFERPSQSVEDVEVVFFPKRGKRVRSTALRLYQPLCLRIGGSTALFYLVNLVPIWLQLARRIAKTRPNVIVITDPIFGLSAVLMKRLLPIRVVFDYVDDLSGLAKGYVTRLLEGAVMKVVEEIVRYSVVNADATIVSSVDLQRRVCALLGRCPPLIPNGVEASIFTRSDSVNHRQKIVGYVGGVYGWSGIEQFLATHRAVSASAPGVEYHIYGSGSCEELVRSISEREEGVYFHGEIPYKEVPCVMSTFDVGIIPFVKSPLTDAACPLKLFEYWAAGVPVVSRNLREVKRLGDGAALFFDTVDEMASDIVLLLLSEETRKKVTSEGSARVVQYDWRVLRTKYREILCGSRMQDVRE